MASPAQGRPPVSHDARILGIAADHIRRFGRERTTIVSIARTAAMSHANVYRYFESKEALIDAVTAQWLKPIEAGLRDIANSADPAYDKIERMLAVVYRGYRAKLESDPALFALLVEAAGVERPVATRHYGRLRAELKVAIEEGMAGGGFPNGDIVRAVDLVVDAAHRFIHPAAVGMDASISRPQIDARFSRVSRFIGRALVAGIR